MSSSVGMIIPNWMENKIVQTTNQFPYLSIYVHIFPYNYFHIFPYISISFHILTPWPTSHLHFFHGTSLICDPLVPITAGAALLGTWATKPFSCVGWSCYIWYMDPSIYPIHVGIYTSTMDSMGMLMNVAYLSGCSKGATDQLQTQYVDECCIQCGAPVR